MYERSICVQNSQHGCHQRTLTAYNRSSPGIVYLGLDWSSSGALNAQLSRTVLQKEMSTWRWSQEVCISFILARMVT